MNNNLLKTAVFLDSLNKKFINNKLRILSSNRIHKSKFNFFRYITSNQEFRKLPYCDIIINYFKKAEQYYPGSSIYVSEYISNIILKNNDIFKKYELEEKNIENLEKYFFQNTSQKSFDLIKNVLSFSGPNATISCKSSDSNEIIVRKTKNPVFDVCIHKDFAPIYFSKSKSKTQTYLISVADAYIERESELYNLIEESKNHKIPLLLFCRGISDYAVRSLKSIILKNNIHILPYIIKFNNDDPFKLEDLASVLNTKIVSIETGDNMNKDSVNKSSPALIKAFWDKIEILNPNSEALNDSINKKLLENIDFDLKNYLFKRKARINTNVVEILIPKKEIELLSEIKSLIVSYNNIAVFGLVRNKDKIYSKKCIDIATRLGNNLVETLNSIGYIVLQDSREKK